MEKSKKYFKIDGYEFWMPKELIAWQYECLAREFEGVEMQELNIPDPENLSDEELVGQAVSSLISMLLSSGRYAKLLAILLVPKGQECWDEKYLGDYQRFKKVDTSTLEEIIRVFFSGSGNLIGQLLSFFRGFKGASGKLRRPTSAKRERVS